MRPPAFLLPTLGFLLISMMVGAPPASAEEIRIATWNLEQLAEKSDTGCRPRQEQDYARLRHYVARLDADIIAFQEVENTAAAERVFDPAEYTIEISNRPADGGTPCRNRPGYRKTAIKVGFAIRRGIEYGRNADLTALAGRRRGVDITLFPGRSSLRLLTVHLASGCHSNAEDEQHGKDCERLDRQIPVVEQWLDTRTRQSQSGMALGDFNRRLTEPEDRVWADLNDAASAPYALFTRGHKQACNGPYEGAPHIDHLIANAGALAMLSSRLMTVRFEERGDAAPSDHCPLAVNMTVR